MLRKPAVSALVILVFMGCQTAFQQRPYQQLLDRPEVTFQGKEQKFTSFFEAEPVFRFQVDNPNPLGLSVKNMTFNLTILDQKFITGISDQGILIRPATSETVELTLPLNFMDVFDTADALQKTPHARFDLIGEMAVGPFFIPYDISGELEIPRIPSVTVESVKIKDRSPGHLRLSITLILNNPNPFPTPQGFLEYTTILADTTLGKGWLTPIDAVDALGQKRMTIPFEAGGVRAGGAISAALKKSVIDCKLSGAIRYAVPGRGRRNFPFTFTGRVPIGDIPNHGG
ncbi:LEA type 2 family protein [Desulfococcus sp.]|uniref:LEA type 2 family protein n=1 Tax=Desulfococcus sp. TaxID=2025834 RepID=UPI003593F007